MRYVHEDGRPFHPEEQLQADMEEQKKLAEECLKTLIEQSDELDGGRRYHYITRYGTHLLQEQALRFALDAYKKAY